MKIRKNIQTKIAIGLTTTLLFFGTMQNASADVLDFDEVTTSFWIGGTTDSGMNLNRTAEGFATLASGYQESYWRGNGTGRILSWTNRSSVSGFSLADSSGDLFSLQSFDFGNGYVSGRNSISSLTLTGNLSGGGIISQTIANAVNGWTTVSLSSAWSNLESVVFQANGRYNRTVWDNITVNSASVPEPTTLGLLMAGLAGLGLVRRKQTT